MVKITRLDEKTLLVEMDRGRYVKRFQLQDDEAPELLDALTAELH